MNGWQVLGYPTFEEFLAVFNQIYLTDENSAGVLRRVLQTPERTFVLGLTNMLRNPGRIPAGTWKVFLHFTLKNDPQPKLLLFVRASGATKTTSRGSQNIVRTNDFLITITCRANGRDQIRFQPIVSLSSKSPIYSRECHEETLREAGFMSVPFERSEGRPERPATLHYMPYLGEDVSSPNILSAMTEANVLDMLNTILRKIIETNFEVGDIKIPNILAKVSSSGKIYFRIIDFQTQAWSPDYLSKSLYYSIIGSAPDVVYRVINEPDFNIRLCVAQIIRSVVILCRLTNAVLRTLRMLKAERILNRFNANMQRTIDHRNPKLNQFATMFDDAIKVINSGEDTDEYFWQGERPPPPVRSYPQPQQHSTHKAQYFQFPGMAQAGMPGISGSPDSPSFSGIPFASSFPSASTSSSPQPPVQRGQLFVFPGIPPMVDASFPVRAPASAAAGASPMPFSQISSPYDFGGVSTVEDSFTTHTATPPVKPTQRGPSPEEKGTASKLPPGSEKK